MDQAKKNNITNYVGLAVVILTAVDQYIKTSAGGDINYTSLGLAVLTAIIAWFTGK